MNINRLYFPHNKFFGVELDRNVLSITKESVDKYNNIEIVCGDAYKHIDYFYGKITHLFCFCEANSNLSASLFNLMIDSNVRYVIFSETNSVPKDILKEIKVILGLPEYLFDIKIFSTSQIRFMSVYCINQSKKELLRERFHVYENKIFVRNY